MHVKVNTNLFSFIFMSLFAVIDSFVLSLLGENNLAFSFYIIINILFFSLLCSKKEPENCLIYTIVFMIVYTFCIDVYIHYFKMELLFETEFIYLFPLILTCLKTKNKNSKYFLLFCILYIIFNFIVLIFSQKISLMGYVLAMVNVLTFIMFYYCFNNIKITKNMVDIYKYIFLSSVLLTFIQTYVGFHNDTRNGLFSVFGWGANTFFIMFYLVYTYTQFLKKKTSLNKLIICIILCTAAYICTESKAALVMVFITMIVMTFISKGFSLKKIIIIILAILMVPFAFQLLIKYNPKFAYMNNMTKIIGYYTGNNDTRYKYGRFTAISESYKNLSPFRKIVGMGFGSATPLYHVFYEELGKTPPEQYYINKYGYYYGFQNTTTGSFLLDGGLILLAITAVFITKKFLLSIRNIKKYPDDISNYIQFGMFTYFIYIVIYANIFKDFRYMAIAGIILGIKNISLTNPNNNEVNLIDKDSNSVQ